MPQYKLKLNNGTLLDVQWCGASGNELWIDVYNKKLFECAVIFDNPELTRRMEYQYGEMSTVHEGYTFLEQLGVEDDHVKVAMRKG